MKIYKVKVNGKVYEVELEAVSEVEGSVSAPAQEAKAPEAKAPISGGAATIEAPIAGKVLKVNVKVGDTVKKGQIVAIIEAMKLENEILADTDGTVKEVCVSTGAQVNNKDVLIVLA